jgi:hypothetical protein
LTSILPLRCDYTKESAEDAPRYGRETANTIR